MLSINIIRDEELQSVCNTFISGLLPHENYDPKCFSFILNTLTKYILMDEFTMEYRILLGVIEGLNKIRCSYEGYAPKLHREVFSNQLEMILSDTVLDKRVGVVEWLDSEGLNSDMNIQSVKEEACQKLYNRCMDLYDDCYGLAIPSTDVVNYVPSLQAAFLNHVSRSSLEAQVKILSSSVRVGRREFSGIKAWTDFIGLVHLEVKARLDDADNGRSTSVSGMDTIKTFKEELALQRQAIANYDIPEIDKGTPMLRHRLQVFVGKENVGKTKFAVCASIKAVKANARVLYMCGESTKSIVWAELVTSYVYQVFGHIVRVEDIYNPADCPPVIQKEIGLAIAAIGENELVRLRPVFTYGMVYEELKEEWESNRFDVVIIDHSCALSGTTGDGSLKAKVDSLARDARDFKKDYPVCIMIMSHPSSDTRQDLARDKAVNNFPTKGSQDLSTEADDIFILTDNEALQKQDLMAIINNKRRGVPRIIDSIILTKVFAASTYVYDPSNQASSTTVSIAAQNAIDIIESDYEKDDIYTL